MMLPCQGSVELAKTEGLGVVDWALQGGHTGFPSDSQFLY